MADTEEYFPRGGKKPGATRFKPSGNFLGAPEKAEKKKKKSKSKSEGDDGYLSDEFSKELDQSNKNCAIGLSYKTVKPGVLILGRIKQVLETKMYVMLPGRMSGVVMACHISEPYNKLLEEYVNDKIDKVRELPQMFKPGQYVALKVLELKSSNQNQVDNLMLSMMPQHINGGRTHMDLFKGALLQAAVASIEDHGYLMDIGVPNTKAFLPKSKVNPEIELDLGVITWCCIRSVKQSPDNSIITLSNELEALQNLVLWGHTTGSLLPGTNIELTVDKPLESGIEGHVFDGTTAYIQRQQADKVKGKKPTLGQKIRSRVLYVMPTRNCPFLTMKDIFSSTYPNLGEEQKWKEGDIVEEAQVLKITGRCIHFKLGKDSFGTMSLRRVQVDEELSDEEVIANSYPIGSYHKVRILCYNLSDYVYSVSDESNVLRQKYFNVNSLHVGDVVDATVTVVGDSHLSVVVGRVNGLVPHAHLTDAGVFIDPKKASTPKIKKKFKVGQEVKGRVLSVDHDKQMVFLTLKPSLLDPQLEVLQSYDQVQIGKAYTGIIKHIKDYILVSFFNNVIAYVPRVYVTKEPIENLVDSFHVGQIVNCTVLRVDVANKKMSGSFTTTPFWPEKKRENTQKRKSTDESPLPNKKLKSEETEGIKKKNKSDRGDSENKKEKKKKKSKDIEEVKISEESDAIETDIHEDSDHVLTADDLNLLDFSDCLTGKSYKKRVVSILKSIKARMGRIDKIDKKIAKIEEKGLSAKNKKFHTAMHMEKLTIQERVKKLLEGLKIAQEKLKEFDLEPNTEYKKKKDKIKTDIAETDEETAPEENAAEKRKRKKEKKSKEVVVDVPVVESLEPVIDVPDAKDFWTETTNSPNNVKNDESSSSEEEEKEQPKKKRKKLTVAEKVAKAREEEERVRDLERRAIESEAQPRSTEQFERALLANPDSSQLWIAYIAFHLQATEIEKARSVARKALKTISFREEDEKLNVWLAMLNFENRFGTKESQQSTLEEAIQMNEPYKVHSKLLDIYVETSKPQELSSLVDLMLRKYRRETAMYAACARACFTLGLVDKGRQVMQKGLTALEKKEHVALLVQFALLERSLCSEAGGRERAEALFEQVLAVYPQRVDVCAVYVDMLLKDGDVNHIRQVIERMTSQKLPARKMKVLYKKWIEVEEKIGDSEQVEKIRQRAVEFIDKARF